MSNSNSSENKHSIEITNAHVKKDFEINKIKKRDDNNNINDENEQEKSSDVNSSAIIITIPRDDHGFGFNVRGPVSEGGQMKSINGELYGPMQHVSALLKYGSAEKAGLKVDDMILEINGVNVEGFNHRSVIIMLRSSPDPLVLTVIRPEKLSKNLDINDSGGKLITNNDNNINGINGYSIKDANYNGIKVDLKSQQHQQQLLQHSNHHHHHYISIPDYQEVSYKGESYIVFNIYLNGRLICCRRYSHFDKLYKLLKSHFPKIHFLTLPGKKFFQLNEMQLDNRRRGLERFIVSACSVEEVFNSDIIKQFLNWNTSDSTSLSSLHLNDQDDDDDDDVHHNADNDHVKVTKKMTKVTMKILMPDHSLVDLDVHSNDHTEQVYLKLANYLGLRTDVLPYFALFEMTDGGFERKLSSHECPYFIYLSQTYDNLASCVTFNKWIFSKKKEKFICKDPLVTSLIHSQAVENIRSNQMTLDSVKDEAERLLASGRRFEFLEVLRRLDDYGTVTFPHCFCDSRKHGHVICVVSFDCFKLIACTVSGVPESNIIKLEWNQIENYELQQKPPSSPTNLYPPSSSSSFSSSSSSSSSYFTMTFKREDKPVRTIIIYSEFSQYLFECFNKVQEERKEIVKTSH